MENKITQQQAKRAFDFVARCLEDCMKKDFNGFTITQAARLNSELLNINTAISQMAEGTENEN